VSSGSENSSQQRHHLTIGEVLNLLKEEFPDITISKIRFLESQGLLQPERTPSGYRKFYQEDVERLRYILSQQKERFLPLKVIKKQLTALDRAGEPVPSRTNADLSVSLPVGEELPEGEGPLFSREALADAAEIDYDSLSDLEGYGLIEARTTSEGKVYTEEDLKICKLAKAMMRHGLQARHLRMYKIFADKEAGLFEQLVEPIMRQRNPEARKIARSTLGDLAALGKELKHELLKRRLRYSTD
jgi:DNA-binding transcriptional MerR regulator